MTGMELRRLAMQALCTADPAEKVAAVMAAATHTASLSIVPHAPLPTDPLPGRPARPELIHPSRVPRRSPFRPEGLAALLHAIAHIEFNAINSGFDATGACPALR